MAGKYDKNIKITVDDNGSLKQKTKDVNKLNKAVDKNNKKSGNLDRNMKGNAKMSANASKNFSKQAQGMQGVLVPAYAEVAARVFALTAAYTALQRASQFGILLKGQQEYAAQTGKNMAQIARTIQKASGYMLDFQEASTSTALATTAGLTAKQIERMTKGARAASVALGRNMGDAMDRLTRGIVKAEPEILDELGVIIRLDKVYKDFAHSINKTTTELTEMEKLTARNTAIMGQLEGKFGDIATSIPADAFAKLSASFTDILLNVGSGATTFLTPFIDKLAEAENLLKGIMLLVARSLLSKVFPVFKDMGAKLDSYSKTLLKAGQTLEKVKRNFLLSSGVSSVMLKGQETAGKKLFSLLGEWGGKALGKAMANKGNMSAAELLGKHMGTSAGKGLMSSLSHAKRDLQRQKDLGVKDPTVETPAFKGATQAQIDLIDKAVNSFKLFGKEIQNISKASRGSFVLKLVEGLHSVGGAALNATKYVANAGASFMQGARSASILKAQGFSLGAMFKLLVFNTNNTAKGMDKFKTELTKSSRVASAFTLTLQAMSTALNFAVSILSIKMMVQWIGREILDWNQAATNAHKAVDDLTDTLTESMAAMKKQVSTRGNIGDSIADSLRSSETKNNMASGLSEAMNEAVEMMSSEALAADKWGTLLDDFMDSVGIGLADKLEESIGKALTNLSFTMSPDEWLKFKEDTSLRDKLVGSIDPNAGASEKLMVGTASTLVGAGALATGVLSISTAWGAAIAAATGFFGVAAAGLSALIWPVTLIVGGLGALYYGFTNLKEGVYKLTKTSEEAADAVISVLDGVNAGTLTPELAVRKLGDELDMSKEKALSYYSDLTAAAKLHAEVTKSQTDAIKNLTDSMGNLVKIRDSFLKGMIKGGDLRDFAKSAKGSIASVSDKLVTDTVKFRELNDKNMFGANYSKLPEDAQTILKHWDTQLKVAQKGLIAIQNRIYSDEEQKTKDKNAAQRRINDITKMKGTAEAYEYSVVWRKTYAEVMKADSSLTETQAYNATARRMVHKLAGGDAEKQYNLELKLSSELEANKLKIVNLDKYGTSATEAKSKILVENLKKEKQIAEGRFAFRIASETLSAEEEKQLQQTIDNIDTKIKHASRTAGKLNKRFHEVAGTTQTISDILSAALVDNEFIVDADFEAHKVQVIDTAFNKLNNSLDETFQETQKVTYAMDLLRNKFGKDIFNTTSGMKLWKKWTSLFTEEGKLLKAKKKQIRDELYKIVLESDNIGIHTNLVSLKTDMLELEMNVLDKSNDNIKKQTQLAMMVLAFEKTKKELKELEATEQYAPVKLFFEESLAGMGQTISGAISDALMRKEPDDDLSTKDRIRLALAQTASDATGEMVSGFITKGTRSLLASATESIFGKDAANAIFPPSERDKLMKTLEDMRELISAQLNQLSNGVIQVVDISDPEARAKKAESLAYDSMFGNTGIVMNSSIFADKTERDWFEKHLSGFIKESTTAEGFVMSNFADLQKKINTALQGRVSTMDEYQKFLIKSKAGDIVNNKPTDKDSEGFSSWFKNLFSDTTKISVPVGGVNVGTDIKSIKKVFSSAVDAVEDFTSSTETAVQIIEKSTETVSVENKLKKLARPPMSEEDKLYWENRSKEFTDNSNKRVAAEKKAQDLLDAIPSKLEQAIDKLKIVAVTQKDISNGKYLPTLSASGYKVGGYSNDENAQDMLDVNTEIMGKFSTGSYLEQNPDFFLKDLENLRIRLVQSFKDQQGNTLGGGLNQEEGLLIIRDFESLVHELAHSLFKGFKPEWNNYLTKSGEDYQNFWKEQNYLAASGDASVKNDIFDSFNKSVYTKGQNIEEIIVRTVDAMSKAQVGTTVQDVTPEYMWNSYTQDFKEMLRILANPTYKSDRALDTLPKALQDIVTSRNNADGYIKKNVEPWIKVPANIAQQINEQFERMISSGKASYKGETLWRSPLDGSFETSDLKKYGPNSPINANGKRTPQPEWYELDTRVRAGERKWKNNKRGKWLQDAQDGQSKAKGTDSKGQGELFRLIPALEGLTKTLDTKVIQSMNGSIALGNVFDPKNGKNARSMLVQLILQILPTLFPSKEATSEYTTDPTEMLMNGGSSFKKRAISDTNRPLGNYGPTASELDEGNVLEMFWNIGLRIGEKINEALGIKDRTNSIDQMKAPQKFEYTNPYSVDADSNIGQKLESIVLSTPTLELQNAALTAAINASNGRGGSTKVEVVNPLDIKTPTTVSPGQPAPVTDPKGDATTNQLSTDLRRSMASNLNSQIQNDNLNARAFITNSLSQVGTNMMSGAINSFFGFANGGVAKGGFRAFANGGTVTKPTLGLVGEGKYNEAVVPLPDGKSIPVMGSAGSTENNVTVNVTVDKDGNAESDTNSGMDGDKAKALGYMVSQAVQQELVEQQRPGGLLSSY